VSPQPPSAGLGRWAWREAPADGGRDFGNANAYATPADLETLVRETTQNSLDASVAGGRVTMRFSLIEIEKTSAAYETLSALLDLPSLHQHVVASSKMGQKFGARLKAGISALEKSETFMMLRIEDFGTTGLIGGEHAVDDETNPFAAFVRNNLDSSKSTTGAGGSFGLGKAASWTCSNLFTVALSTNVAERPRHLGEDAMRFIAKSELAWHELDGQAYAGPGWLSDAEESFSSSWLPPSSLEALFLDRSNLPEGVDETDHTGTSLLILGFHDPAQDGPPDGTRVVDDLVRAAAANFWPAILDEALTVRVDHLVDGRCVRDEEVRPDDYVPEFAKAYRTYREGDTVTVGERVNDVVKCSIPLGLMPTRKDQASVTPIAKKLDAETHLVVRLTDSKQGNGDPDTNLVALVRGRKMVVKYVQQRAGLSSGFSYHGILLAGTAAVGAAHALEAEEFLRLTEPPAHDAWEYSQDLKGVYVDGTRARLQEFFRSMSDALRDVTQRRDDGDDVGPLELRRLLTVSGEGSPGSGVSASLRKAKAVVDGDAWKVGATVQVRRHESRLKIRPRLALKVEQGHAVPLKWSSLEWFEDVTHGVDEHGPWCIVEPIVTQVRFEGVSASTAAGIPATASRLSLDVDAESMIDDA